MAQGRGQKPHHNGRLQTLHVRRAWDVVAWHTWETGGSKIDCCLSFAPMIIQESPSTNASFTMHLDAFLLDLSVRPPDGLPSLRERNGVREVNSADQGLRYLPFPMAFFMHVDPYITSVQHPPNSLPCNTCLNTC